MLLVVLKRGETIPHQHSGPIYGARTGMTANLRALVPKTKKVRTGQLLEEIQAAA